MTGRGFAFAVLFGAASLFLGSLALPRAGSTSPERGSVDLTPSPKPARAVTPEQASEPTLDDDAEAPALLSDTGLYVPGSSTEVDPKNLPYAPQYPLWTDGALKKRWIRLPEGSAIDGSNPDAWRFPAGTRLWKEFSFGRRVETRFIRVRADGSFLYATYVWDADGSRAVLAPRAGVQGAGHVRPGVAHDAPGQWDCRACHEGKPERVLGFTALQLSPDRDENAVHREALPEGAVDLVALVERGLLRNFPKALVEKPPRIGAPTPVARAALGYLVGNCAGCHNGRGPLASLGLDLDQRLLALHGDEAVKATAFGQPSQFRPPGASGALRVAPGRPKASTLVLRMGSRVPALQMPPLGTKLVDRAGLALIERWISEDR